MSNYSVFPNTCPRVRFGGLMDPPYLCHAKALAFRPLARGREFKRAKAQRYMRTRYRLGSTSKDRLGICPRHWCAPLAGVLLCVNSPNILRTFAV